MLEKEWKHDPHRNRLVLYVKGEEKIEISRIDELWIYFKRAKFWTLEALKEQAEMIVGTA